MSAEEKDLETHVALCELRYRALETRLDGLETRLVKLESEMSAIKAQMHAGFTDIKLLLEQRNTSKSNQLMATIGVLGSAGLALLGYILTRN